MTGETREYDVAIIGGAFAGAATAIVLKQARPELRILIVESRTAFDRKVGESAIELSSWFLMRVLDLDRHLAVEQLPKYGQRFWFSNEKVSTLAEASELGSNYQSRVPSWHLDRAILDEHVLRRAVQAGADLARPARVTAVSLQEGGTSTLEVESASGGFTAKARWVVDASGRKAWLARRLDLIEEIPEHPTRSIWARYRGTRDFDGPLLASIRKKGRMAAICSRGLATNHLTGPGYWIWFIPLPGGDTSVGIVWDERILTLPDGDSPGERFETFLRSLPAGRELLEGAERIPDDLRVLNRLPYRVRKHMGDGWVLVGDASGFIDPFYSPGLDWCACTIVKSTEIILKAVRGEGVTEEVARYNTSFVRSFRRWLQAIYVDKYWYMGDLDLMNIALRIEVPLYYLGVVAPAYRKGPAGLEPFYGPPPAIPFFLFMRFVNRRLAALGKIKIKAGTWGRHNHGRHVLLPGFKLGLGDLKYIPGALARLAWLELASIPERIRARRPRAAMSSDRPSSAPAGMSAPAEEPALGAAATAQRR